MVRKKEARETTHLSECVNLSDLGLEYFVDCERFKFDGKIAGMTI